jgi:1-pyrroline-5-carboxylate dehydrogenase
MQLAEFRNEPLTDFTVPANRAAMQAAVDRVGASLGGEYANRIGAEDIRTRETFRSLNPARKDQVVGVHPRATPDLAKRAVETAAAAFPKWRDTPVETRVGALLRASEILKSRRHELSAWMVYEVGKSWVEADADTAEAIDFLEFYAREMLRYAAEQPLTRIPAERNRLVYIPLGAGVVVPPWNFPLAILTGMTSAALVTGNTVVLKPSSDSPTVGAKMFEIFREARIPDGVLNFLTGPGGGIGDALVAHPRTRFVTFTGSKEVGLRINRLAADAAPGQIWIKRVVAEMGGKDSILVDETADLEKAAADTVASAFGFQGQKCSACSRVIVTEPVYERFLPLLVERAKAIRVGEPKDAGVTMGPVVNERAFRSITDYIRKGIAEGARLLAGGEAAAGAGWFIPPTILADVKPDATVAQEEIFGPVLAVLRAKDWNEGLEIANNTEYGLTGAVFTRSPERLEEAARRFHVGNLYLNRKCTGALVGVHPFGGFNMSGTDSKAGGRDYLLLFLQAKVVSEAIPR